MSPLVHCIYTSVQTRPLSDAEITHLVEHSRRSNARQGVTGILLHVRDTFFQILEGPQEIVEELYGKILQDRRHTHITRIIFETIPKRYFGDSDMTLATLTPTELAAILDEDSLEHREKMLAGLDEGRAKRLLRAFTDGRWRKHIPVAKTAVRA